MLTNEDKKEVADIVAEAVKAAMNGVTDAIKEGMSAKAEEKVTKERIMSIRDNAVRQEMIRRHPEAFSLENMSEEEQIRHEFLHPDRTDPVFEERLEQQIERISQLPEEERRGAILAIKDKDGGAKMRQRLIEKFPELFAGCALVNPWARKKPVKKKENKKFAEAREAIAAISDPYERKAAITKIKDRSVRIKMIEENADVFSLPSEEPEDVAGNGTVYTHVSIDQIGGGSIVD